MSGTVLWRLNKNAYPQLGYTRTAGEGKYFAQILQNGGYRYERLRELTELWDTGKTQVDNRGLRNVVPYRTQPLKFWSNQKGNICQFT